MPQIDKQPLLAAWQDKVFDLFLAAGKIDQETVDQRWAWPHSGFSVDNSVFLPYHDKRGLERLAQYMLRCPFSLARVVCLTAEGSVIYRADEDDCRRFPGPASGDGHRAQLVGGGPKRNFQVFSALDFLAEVTQHIPEKCEHLVRGHRPKVGRGWYSHRQRGIRAKAAAEGSGSFSGHEQTENPDTNDDGRKT